MKRIARMNKKKVCDKDDVGYVHNILQVPDAVYDSVLEMCNKQKHLNSIM